MEKKGEKKAREKKMEFVGSEEKPNPREEKADEGRPPLGMSCVGRWRRWGLPWEVRWVR